MIVRQVVKMSWTIADLQVPIEDHAILLENGRIAVLTREPPAEVELISLPDGIALPGRRFARKLRARDGPWGVRKAVPRA